MDNIALVRKQTYQSGQWFIRKTFLPTKQRKLFRNLISKTTQMITKETDCSLTSAQPAKTQEKILK